MREECMVLTCDRCGTQINLERIKDETLDGGFTTHIRYKSAPNGWDKVTRPAFHPCDPECGTVDLCPMCTQRYRQVMEDFFISGGKHVKSNT